MLGRRLRKTERETSKGENPHEVGLADQGMRCFPFKVGSIVYWAPGGPVKGDMEHGMSGRSPYESRPFSPPQEHSIKVLELISTIWDTELHVAGLRLLNNLPLPDYVHPQLRRVMPALMEIMQSDYVLAQVPAHQGRGAAPRGKSRGSSLPC